MDGWWDVLDVSLGVLVGVGVVITTMSIPLFILYVFSWALIVWWKDELIVPSWKRMIESRRESDG